MRSDMEVLNSFYLWPRIFHFLKSVIRCTSVVYKPHAATETRAVDHSIVTQLKHIEVTSVELHEYTVSILRFVSNNKRVPDSASQPRRLLTLHPHTRR